VGAVLVNARNEIRGTGYNGSPAGLPGCLTDRACPRGRLSYDEVPADSDYSNCIADHAERNALRHSRPEDLKGATLYVTRPPCPSCTTLINACGIVRVVSPGVNRCLGFGEYEGHGSHVYTKVDEPKPECVHYMVPVGDLGGSLCELCGYFRKTDGIER
jgi:dCMP deaminase